MEVIITTIISGITSITVVIVTNMLVTRREIKAKKIQEQERINREYLNPVRLYLVENYFRIQEITRKIKLQEGVCRDLLYFENSWEISNQNPEWFIHEGHYLISSCYLTACLFYYLRKLRDDLPYLRLLKEDDTALLSLLLKLNISFLKDLGIYYVLQPSIGIDMYSNDEKRIISYREFCLKLKDHNNRLWFDRLITFYIETGQGKKLGRIQSVLEAIDEMTKFLDRAVAGGEAISHRLAAEDIQSF